MTAGGSFSGVLFDKLDYEALNRELVRQQLAKAGYRLAKLLDAIFA
jgi:hypothetical protein